MQCVFSMKYCHEQLKYIMNPFEHSRHVQRIDGNRRNNTFHELLNNCLTYLYVFLFSQAKIQGKGTMLKCKKSCFNVALEVHGRTR